MQIIYTLFYTFCIFFFNMPETLTSEEIINARIKLGLTKTAFGEMLGAKLRTVQSWEIGERNMPTVTAMLLQKKRDK